MCMCIYIYVYIYIWLLWFVVELADAHNERKSIQSDQDFCLRMEHFERDVSAKK